MVLAGIVTVAGLMAIDAYVGVIGAVTVKVKEFDGPPVVVAIKSPVVVAAPTVAVSEVELHVTTGAFVPLMAIVAQVPFGMRFVPVTTTEDPTAPEFGLMPAIVGAGITPTPIEAVTEPAELVAVSVYEGVTVGETRMEDPVTTPIH